MAMKESLAHDSSLLSSKACHIEQEVGVELCVHLKNGIQSAKCHARLFSPSLKAAFTCVYSCVRRSIFKLE